MNKEELQKKHLEAIDNDPLSIVIGREKASIAHTTITLQTVRDVLEKLRKPDGKFLGKRIDDAIDEYNTYLQSQK